MSNLKKMAVLCVTSETLRMALNLPVGTEVIQVDLLPNYRGVLNITIQGAGYDTSEGSAIMSVEPTIQVVHQVIAWDFSE